MSWTPGPHRALGIAPAFYRRYAQALTPPAQSSAPTTPSRMLLLSWSVLVAARTTGNTAGREALIQTQPGWALFWCGGWSTAGTLIRAGCKPEHVHPHIRQDAWMRRGVSQPCSVPPSVGNASQPHRKRQGMGHPAPPLILPTVWPPRSVLTQGSPPENACTSPPWLHTRPLP